MGCAACSSCPRGACATHTGPVESGCEFDSKYMIGTLLGEGKYGKVFIAHPQDDTLGRDQSDLLEGCAHTCDESAARAATTRTKYCVKVVEASRMISPASDSKPARWAIDDEITTWRQLGKHNHCVEFIESFVQKRWYMVMERCDGSLLQRWARVKELLETDCTRVFREMLLGVAHVHQMAIVHRDIKVDNFLLGGSLGSTVKLADFGFAVQMPSDRLLTLERGTVPYMSPEMVAGVGYDYKTDVWSLGSTIHFLLSLEFPYMPPIMNAAEMKAAILADAPTLDLDWVDTFDELFSFMKNMLSREQALRYTVKQLLSLPSLCPARRTLRISLSQIKRIRTCFLADQSIEATEMQSPAEGGDQRQAVLKPYEASILLSERKCSKSTQAYTSERRSSKSTQAYTSERVESLRDAARFSL